MLSESVGEVGRFFRPLAQLHPPLEQLRPMNIRVVQVEGMPILSQDGLMFTAVQLGISDSVL